MSAGAGSSSAPKGTKRPREDYETAAAAAAGHKLNGEGPGLRFAGRLHPTCVPQRPLIQVLVCLI